LPLEALLGHIDSLIHQICELERTRELDQIPFSKVRNILNSSINNYKNGMSILREGLEERLIKKAELYAKSKTKDGRFLSAEQVIYTFYRELVSTSYGIGERLSTDIAMLVKGGIPPEIYHWLLEIPEHFKIDKPIVLHAGQRFISETFDQKIIKPLKPMIDLAKRPEVRGSLAQLKPIDLTKSHPIEDGYVVSCVRGEAQNPVLWPILCHEMFEIVDKEQHILRNLEQFASNNGAGLPILDSDAEINMHWTLEILMDFLSINSFGPMYAKSLLEYFKRSPYYQTIMHPEMSSRLFCAYLHLRRPSIGGADIFGKCQYKARQEVEPEIKRYRAEKELDTEKEAKLSSLYSLMIQFLKTIELPSFLDRLRTCSERTGDPKTTLKELLKDETRKFIPFQDPVFKFNDIRNNILYHHISLAIDPNIMLNVVLANYDQYRQQEHLPVIVDSIKKWKVKQVWNYSVDLLVKKS